MSNLIKLIEKAEDDWQNKAHTVCPRCGAEVLAETLKDGTHKFLCDEIVEATT